MNLQVGKRYKIVIDSAAITWDSFGQDFIKPFKYGKSAVLKNIYYIANSFPERCCLLFEGQPINNYSVTAAGLWEFIENALYHYEEVNHDYYEQEELEL